METIAKMKENLPFFDNTAIHLNVPQARPKENFLFMREDGRLDAAGVDYPNPIAAEKM
jgi:hypothetical protein